MSVDSSTGLLLIRRSANTQVKKRNGGPKECSKGRRDADGSPDPMPSSFAKQDLAGHRKWNCGREPAKEDPFEDQT